MCALPDDILLEILRHLPGVDRLSTVPCVCKRWQSLHSKPSKMWRSIYWDLGMHPDDGRGLFSHMDFLRKRLPAIQEFEIGWAAVEAEDSRHLKLQTCLALLAAAPDLQELNFLSSDLPLQHASFVRMFSSLRRLHYESVRPALGATAASQLIEPLIQGLRSLEDLHLILEGVTSVKAQGFPMMLTELTALTGLFITVRHVPDMLQFGKLPVDLFHACGDLRDLTFDNCGVTAVPPEVACLLGLTRLQLLSAKPPEGSPQPHVALPPQFTQLRSLVNLKLSSASPPAAVFGMTHLTSLTLDQVVLAPEEGAQLRPLLSLRQLRFLRLCNSAHISAAMTASPGATASRLSPRHLCVDGNSLTTDDLLHMLSWFELGALEILDLRYNSLAILPQEIELMTALRQLDVSWNPPFAMERSDVQLFSKLPEFHRLVVRAWDDCIWNEIQVQTALDIARSFIRPAARLLIGHWEIDHDDTWDAEPDEFVEFLTDHINKPAPNNNTVQYRMPG